MNHDLIPPDGDKTAFRVLAAVSLAHFLNDTTQSLLVPTYPLLKDKFSLNFTQIGLITLTYQITASLLQPLIGRYTDRRPRPYSLPIGMAFTMSGILIMAFAPAYHWLALGAALLGTGSSIFHPESARIARLAAGGRYGLAQSIFQVGGNGGSSCGPLLAAAVIIPNGQSSLSWFIFLPLSGMAVLTWVSGWAKDRIRRNATKVRAREADPPPRRVIVRAMTVLLILIFSKYFYVASITSYFIFYLTRRFGVSVQAAQIQLFVFLFAMAAGTVIGGPIGDRIGRKRVIWLSILGAAPFTLALPYADLAWTGFLVFATGFILSSAFPAIVVFAQELMPGHVGSVAGLFFGLSFGMGGIGAAVLGWIADVHGIDFVYHLCAFLPLLGLAAAFLPDLRENRAK
jgi:FSR family fosmidomycin resistance protein-like MFS transporter